jgi:hypothetical protein
MYKNIPTIFALHHFFLLPSPYDWYPPQKGPVLPSCPTFLRVYRQLRGICLGISDMYVSFFNQINPHIIYFSSIVLLPIIYQRTLHYIILYYLHTQMKYFNIFTP